MAERRVEKVHNRQRIGSSLDPDLFYEFLHVRMEGGEDIVVIQMVRGSAPGSALPARIPLKDLKDVEEELILFMDGVRRRTGDSTMTRAFFTMGGKAPEEEHAVFRPPPKGTPQTASRPVAEVGGMVISAGPRKMGYDPRLVAAAAGSERAPASTPSMPAAVPPGPSGPVTYKILGFSLTQPPTVEVIVREIQSDMKRLVVVARRELEDRVKKYLDGVMGGNRELSERPAEFEAIVIQRKGGKGTLKHKMGAALAQGIVEVVSNPTKVLWIPPEMG
ncbi:MAG TPA: hypothetical protein VK661_10625 [Planctomycetota bacterium]|nr:hypothetical protein [Planctomycetota bacterium]